MRNVRNKLERKKFKYAQKHERFIIFVIDCCSCCCYKKRCTNAQREQKMEFAKKMVGISKLIARTCDTFAHTHILFGI